MASEPGKFDEFEEFEASEFESETKENAGDQAGFEEPVGDPGEGEGAVDGDSAGSADVDEAAAGGGDKEDAPAELLFSKDKQQQEETQGIMVKYCIFCRETILADAICCKHCGHVVHIFEGAVFKQLYWFFWAAVITFIGCMLPFMSFDPGAWQDSWELACSKTGVEFNDGNPVVDPSDQKLITEMIIEIEGLEAVAKSAPAEATHSFVGSMYMIFSLLLIAAMLFSIYVKRLVMSPVFLMIIPAVHSWWIVVKTVPTWMATVPWSTKESVEYLRPGPEVDWFAVYTLKWWERLSDDLGSGMILILLGSTIVTLTFIFSLFSAVAGGKGGSKQPARGRRRGR